MSDRPFARVIHSGHSPPPSPRPGRSCSLSRAPCSGVYVRVCVALGERIRERKRERSDGEREGAKGEVALLWTARAAATGSPDRCLVQFQIRGRSLDALRFPRPTRPCLFHSRPSSLSRPLSLRLSSSSSPTFTTAPPSLRPPHSPPPPPAHRPSCVPAANASTGVSLPLALTATSASRRNTVRLASAPVPFPSAPATPQFPISFPKHSPPFSLP